MTYNTNDHWITDHRVKQDLLEWCN